MITIENRCCDCVVSGYPCRGSSCPLRAVRVLTCNKCKEGFNELYEDYKGNQYCYDCMIDKIYQEYGYDIDDEDIELIIENEYTQIK